MRIKKFNESDLLPHDDKSLPFSDLEELFLNVCEKYECKLEVSFWDYNDKNTTKSYRFSLKIPKKFWNGGTVGVGPGIILEKGDSIGSNELRELCDILLELPKIADRIKSLYNHELTFSLSTINQCAIYMNLKNLN